LLKKKGPKPEELSISFVAPAALSDSDDPTFVPR
jgi:hypothetical protein